MPDIKFNCPHCKQSLEAPEDMLGQTIECPACNGEISIPTQKPLPAPLAPPPVPQQKRTKECPFCGEDILLSALKCKHCGEFLNKTASQQRDKKPTAKPFAPPPASHIPHKVATCPKCGSTSIQAVKKGFSAGSGCLGTLLAGPFGLLCGFCGSNKMSSVCLQCGHKWKLG